MKNKVKTNETSFQSYLIRVTNENFEKIKEDRYSYDESGLNLLTRGMTKVKRFFNRKKTGAERKAKREAAKVQTGKNLDVRKTDAQKDLKYIIELVRKSFLGSLFNKYRQEYQEKFAEIQAKKGKSPSFGKVFLALISKYIKIMIGKVTGRPIAESANYGKKNIFMEAKTPSISVDMGGRVVTGIFIYNLQGVEYELNTYNQRFTVKKFAAYPGVPTIDKLWEVILRKPFLSKVNKSGPEEFIQFNPKIFETQIYPFLKAEGDVAISGRARDVIEDEENVKTRTADTNRRTKKIEARTERMETSMRNTDRKINIIMYIGIALLVLMIAGIAFAVYAYISNQAKMDDIMLQNQVSDSVNAQRFGFLSTRMDEIEVKVDNGFETVQKQLIVSDSVNAQRFGSLESTVMDAKKEIMSTISSEIQDAKRKIISKISKSSSALATLIKQNNYSMVSVKNQIASLKIQIGNDQAAVLKAIGMTKEELLKEMQENNVNQKEIGEYLNSKLDRMSSQVDEANTRIRNVAEGLANNGKAAQVGFIDNLLTGKADAIKQAAIVNFNDASREAPQISDILNISGTSR